jgi:hypothetical protein
MRAVALGDKGVQAELMKRFVPLKVNIQPGTQEFPVKWPAFIGWSIAYGIGGGKDNNGFTGCSIVTPDQSLELANTGSAFVWEIFESPAYDPAKFITMMSRAQSRFEALQQIEQSNLGGWAKWERTSNLRREISDAVRREGATRQWPKGLTAENLKELFELAG